jgi:hypothetical protein
MLARILFDIRLSGKVHLDFKNPSALAALTKTLLLGTC